MNFLRKKKILITGHTGFQGYWLANILHANQAKKIYGLGLSPTSFQKKLFHELLSFGIFQKSFYCDIYNQKKFSQLLDKIKPNYIFHLASQPLVGKSYINPTETFNSNINGSIYLLEWLRKSNDNINVIFITSDKCYSPSNKAFLENSPLGGLDPYSASKSIQEILIQSYIYSYFSNKNNIKISSARSGNIYGGGDFTPGRLVPDIISGLLNDKKISLRNPSHIRPWQYVLDSVNGYIKIAEYLNINDNPYESFNFGPKNSLKPISVMDIFNKLLNTHGQKIKVSTPKNILFKESQQINLISKRANRVLGWKNKINLDQGLQDTYKWYSNYYDNPNNIIKYSQQKIIEFYS